MNVHGQPRFASDKRRFFLKERKNWSRLPGKGLFGRRAELRVISPDEIKWSLVLQVALYLSRGISTSGVCWMRYSILWTPRYLSSNNWNSSSNNNDNNNNRNNRKSLLPREDFLFTMFDVLFNEVILISAFVCTWMWLVVSLAYNGTPYRMSTFTLRLHQSVRLSPRLLYLKLNFSYLSNTTKLV